MNVLKTLPLLTLLALLANCSCSKNSTEPPGGPDTTSHDYEWVVDTLLAPGALQVLMSDIWGTDENNVWVVGHSDDYRYQLWHWNGSTWENIPLLFPGHPHSFTAIYGFSGNDIWVVGTDYQGPYPNNILEDFIIHYNGSNWELIEDLDAPWCFSIWGTSNNNLFIGSDSGLILHYNGNVWSKQRTNTKSQILSIWGFSENEVYAAGLHHGNVQPIDSTFYYIYKFNGQDWEIIYTALDYPFAPSLSFGSKLWGDDNHTLYSAGADGFYQLHDNSWSRLIKETLIAIHGMTSNNIFVGGWENQLMHYNGNNWFSYEQLKKDSRWISGIWNNNDNVFIISRAINQSFIYRGALSQQ